MSKIILWASVHQPTQDQLNSLNEMGEVRILQGLLLAKLSDSPSDRKELAELAFELLEFSSNAKYDIIVQPAGSPAFLAVLGEVLALQWTNKEINQFVNHQLVNKEIRNLPTIMFSHSKRISEDIPQPDGSVKKVSTFKHEKWIEL